MLKRNLANIITMARIIGTLSLWLLKPLDSAWLIVYGLCGVSDVVDGTLARRLGIQSRFGARLDSASDLLFYGTMLLQLLPCLYEVLPHWFWFLVGAVCLTRIVDYSYAAIRFHRFAATHAILNKLSGFMIFLVPYTMYLGKPFVYYACSVAGVTFAAAVYELGYHLRMKP